MKKILFGFALLAIVGLFFVSHTSACKECEIGESVMIDKTAYKEGFAQIKEI